MGNNSFTDFLISSYINPQFSDVELLISESKKPHKQRTTLSVDKTEIRLILPEKQILEIKRTVPFSTIEIAYLNALTSVLFNFSSLSVEHQIYFHRASYNRIIANTLASLSEVEVSDTILTIIEQLEKWTSETYEGDPINASIGLSLTEESVDEKADPFQIIVRHDFSKVISNARDTIVEFDVKGRYLGYNVLLPDPNLHTSPVAYTAFADYTKHGDRMAFVLCSNRELLIFSNGELTCAKRRGDWRFFNHQQVIHQLAFSNRKLDRYLRQAVYESCLDLSFSRSGACIGVIQKGKEHQLQKDERIHDNDRLALGTSVKSRIIGDRCRNLTFPGIDRRIRQEILSIDGATVLDASGQIIAAGSILRLSAGSEGGARLAAAKCLSQYGLAVKVSSDGEIDVFGTSKNFSFA